MGTGRSGEWGARGLERRHRLSGANSKLHSAHRDSNDEHAGIPVVVVLQTPVPGRLVAVCIVRAGQESCGLSAASLERQTSAVNRLIVDVVHNRPGVHLLDPAKILCDSTGCPAEIEGRVAYYDEDHVATSVAVLPRSVAAWSVALAAAARDAGKKRLPVTPPATPPPPPRRSGQR